MSWSLGALHKLPRASLVWGPWMFLCIMNVACFCLSYTYKHRWDSCHWWSENFHTGWGFLWVGDNSCPESRSAWLWASEGLAFALWEHLSCVFFTSVADTCLCAARLSVCLRAQSIPLFMYILLWCLHKSVWVGLYVKELKFRCLTTCTVCETSEPNPSHLLHKGMPS